MHYVKIKGNVHGKVYAYSLSIPCTLLCTIAMYQAFVQHWYTSIVHIFIKKYQKSSNNPPLKGCMKKIYIVVTFKEANASNDHLSGPTLPLLTSTT